MPGEAMNEDLTREDVHHAADLLVEELLAAAGVTRPPVNAVEVAQRHLKLALREPAPSARAAARKAANGQPRRQSANASNPTYCAVWVSIPRRGKACRASRSPTCWRAGC